MGQSDKAIRRLAELLQAELLRELIGPERLRIVAIEPTELKVVERVTDKVVRALLDGKETIVHVEFQTGDEAGLPARMLAYNGLLRHRFLPLPVYSVVVYLMHEPPRAIVANGIERRLGDEQVEFRYRVIGAWETPVTLERVRACPVLGPFAALTPGIGAGDLSRLQQVFEEEVEPRELAGELLALTFILAGRRFGPDLLESFERSSAMLDSPTYRKIVEQTLVQGRAEGKIEGRVEGKIEGRVEGKIEGRAEGKIEALLKLVEHRLRTVPPWLEPRLRSMSIEAIETLLDRVIETEDNEALRSLVATFVSEG